MRRAAWVKGLCALLLMLALLPLPARVQTTTPNSGLQISPIRRELKVDPGATTTADLVVANLSKQNLNVTLYFREFSVANTEYDYSFQLSRYNWIRISETEVTLTPGQSKTIPFTLSPERGASPGGYYFTIFASSNVQSGGVDSTVQAASVLYVTVNGRLDRSTNLDRVDVPTLLFSPDITYRYDMTNTGNVYYTIYSVARLSNPLEASEGSQAAHIVLPGKPRSLTGSLPAPKLPGLYTATIGYRTDSGNLMTVSKQVFYLPLWGVVAGIGLLFVAYKIVRIIRRRHRR